MYVLGVRSSELFHFHKRRGRRLFRWGEKEDEEDEENDGTSDIQVDISAVDTVRKKKTLTRKTRHSPKWRTHVPRAK